MAADPADLQKVVELFEERIPFNQILGLEIESLDLESTRLRFAFKEELVGNYVRGSLHGGVIASALDTTGGLVAFLNLLDRLEGETEERRLAGMSKIGTIDLRIDYLRSGLGKIFYATGFILRTGNKVAVTRMELTNEEKTLIAVGTGTYLVG